MRPLDELAAMCERATPGPWTSVVAGRPGHGSSGIIAGWGRFVVVTDDEGGPDIPSSADTYFIITAREAMPDLIARVRELEQERGALRKADAPSVALDRFEAFVKGLQGEPCCGLGPKVHSVMCPGVEQNGALVRVDRGFLLDHLAAVRAEVSR